jgi:hypothetical protein
MFPVINLAGFALEIARLAARPACGSSTEQLFALDHLLGDFADTDPSLLALGLKAFVGCGLVEPQAFHQDALGAIDELARLEALRGGVALIAQ